jgi:hypothetical protein
MEDQTKTFGLNVHMHEDFDCDDVHLESRNWVKDYEPVVGSISTPNAAYAFGSIATPNDLNEEAKFAWEVLKVQLILNQKACVLHHKLFLPWHFFVMNDGNNLDFILSQTMHRVICHSICQSYYVGDTIKRKKSMISYN